MARKMAILVDYVGAQARDRVTNAITAQGVSWWHFMQYAWLIVDQLDRGPEFWLAFVRVAVGEAELANARVLVLAVDDSHGWYGFGPHQIYDWLHQNWTG